ncbi:hypothetical protein M413DRAFT_24857 [Hebeloma cylindrosporum]|uniref:non-specific serine/threonine protein kinase n=1 Tax=Hebeloma cylindrosporum TaxID=76867 RepID=A0A0C3CA78_HEBCY|nr:hypothetical protein M413DRAFT_24857 [Hebeloma cylindrosporum h7]
MTTKSILKKILPSALRKRRGKRVSIRHRDDDTLESTPPNPPPNPPHIESSHTADQVNIDSLQDPLATLATAPPPSHLSRPNPGTKPSLAPVSVRQSIEPGTGRLLLDFTFYTDEILGVPLGSTSSPPLPVGGSLPVAGIEENDAASIIAGDRSHEDSQESDDVLDSSTSVVSPLPSPNDPFDPEKWAPVLKAMPSLDLEQVDPFRTANDKTHVDVQSDPILPLSPPITEYGSHSGDLVDSVNDIPCPPPSPIPPVTCSEPEISAPVVYDNHQSSLESCTPLSGLSKLEAGSGSAVIIHSEAGDETSVHGSKFSEDLSSEGSDGDDENVLSPEATPEYESGTAKDPLEMPLETSAPMSPPIETPCGAPADTHICNWGDYESTFTGWNYNRGDYESTFTGYGYEDIGGINPFYNRRMPSVSIPGVDDYEIAGWGGNAVVLRIPANTDSRFRAIKVISCPGARKSSHLKAYASEVFVLQHLRLKKSQAREKGVVDPGMERVLGLDHPDDGIELLSNGHLCISTAYYPADLNSYKGIISRNEEALLTVVAEIAQGLNYLHSLDIVHLDIKPENVLLTLNRHCVIGDYGSSIYAPVLKNNRTIDSCITQAFTIEFAAPEVTTDMDQFDCKADIWSLGVSMFCLIAPLRFRKAFQLDIPQIRYYREMGLMKFDIRARMLEARAPDSVSSLMCELDARERPTALEILTKMKDPHPDSLDPSKPSPLLSYEPCSRSRSYAPPTWTPRMPEEAGIAAFQDFLVELDAPKINIRLLRSDSLSSTSLRQSTRSQHFDSPPQGAEDGGDPEPLDHVPGACGSSLDALAGTWGRSIYG